MFLLDKYGEDDYVITKVDLPKDVASLVRHAIEECQDSGWSVRGSWTDLGDEMKEVSYGTV